MSFHPNDVARRARAAAIISTVLMSFLVSAFFRTQVLRNQQWVLQSEENRLREVPIAAPRGTIYDRHMKVMAENVVGYSVSVLAQSEDSLRGTLARLSGTIQLSQTQMDQAVRRYRRAPTRPTAILNDAPFDVVSVLEEHRVDFPSLIILSTPKRFYPDGPAVVPFIGYVNEISEPELAQPQYSAYKAGQQVGKQGLEKQYEALLHGKEGSRYVEVDARGRIVREQGAAAEKLARQADSLVTNIDLDLQKYVASLFSDSIVGGAVAMDPNNGEILALYSGPSYDPNRFVGGIPFSYWDSLRTSTKRPLYNKALQGLYPPGSTWKLATAVLGLQDGIINTQSRMPQACNGYYYYGNRGWHCWEKAGHGSLTLMGAIAKSCDVYFYQLGLKLGVSRLVAGGAALGFSKKTGVDLPEETKPRFPDRLEYFNERYGPRGWTDAVSLNMAIGQGENAQTILNMARFYSALTSDDGFDSKPELVRTKPERSKLINLTAQQLDSLRVAMVGVTSQGGTAASAALSGGVELAGKTGTAQTTSLDRGGKTCDHAWFVGFAPAEKPKILVSVMIECGGHGYNAARVASAIVAKYLGVTSLYLGTTEGND